MATLTVPRGDTLKRTATIKDQNNAAFDLTGATLWFTVKKSTDILADDTAAISKLYWIQGGASSGISVATPNTGVAVVTMPATDSINLDPNLSYVFDLQVKNAGGEVYTVLSGDLQVAPDVTRRTTTP